MDHVKTAALLDGSLPNSLVSVTADRWRDGGGKGVFANENNFSQDGDSTCFRDLHRA